jgi:hypothetical protein
VSDAPTTVRRAVAAPEPIALRAHPRAARSVRRIRAAAGLAGLALTLVLSLRAGVPAWDATARALIAGVAVHVVAWAVAVAVWRQLMLAELAALHERRQARARRAAELASEA